MIFFTKGDFQIGIRTTTEHTQDGFDDAFSEGGNDIAERSTDDDTGGEIDDVTFEDKFLELVEHDDVVEFSLGRQFKSNDAFATSIFRSQMCRVGFRKHPPHDIQRVLVQSDA